MGECIHGYMDTWMHGYNILTNFSKHYFSITYGLYMHECMDACMHEYMEAFIHACMDAL